MNDLWLILLAGCLVLVAYAVVAWHLDRADDEHPIGIPNPYQGPEVVQ